MGQRHKHADVIIAWAEGEDVQVWDKLHSEWGDVATKSPTWREDWEYRIKPPPAKYRVALFRAQTPHTYTANTQEGARIFDKSPRFIRWLTDWIEYEE